MSNSSIPVRRNVSGNTVPYNNKYPLVEPEDDIPSKVKAKEYIHFELQLLACQGKFRQGFRTRGSCTLLLSWRMIFPPSLRQKRIFLLTFKGRKIFPPWLGGSSPLPLSPKSISPT
jgi:hypothetical protein